MNIFLIKTDGHDSCLADLKEMSPINHLLFGNLQYICKAHATDWNSFCLLRQLIGSLLSNSNALQQKEATSPDKAASTWVSNKVWERGDCCLLLFGAFLLCWKQNNNITQYTCVQISWKCLSFSYKHWGLQGNNICLQNNIFLLSDVSAAYFTLLILYSFLFFCLFIYFSAFLSFLFLFEKNVLIKVPCFYLFYVKLPQQTWLPQGQYPDPYPPLHIFQSDCLVTCWNEYPLQELFPVKKKKKRKIEITMNIAILKYLYDR